MTIRMDARARARLDRLAAKRGTTTGALLRQLGLAAAEREERAEELRRALDSLPEDTEGAAELARRRREDRAR